MFLIISLNTNTKKNENQHPSFESHSVQGLPPSQVAKKNQFMLQKSSEHGFSCYSSN
ncbi:hypothetical protein SMQE30_04750 [Serratia marcescens]|nr:hypothetical protein SMQE30_04750 [Serratia marcescens]